MVDTLFRVRVPYRVVGEELWMVELESGIFFYFSAEAYSFFEFFQTPRSLRGFLNGASIPVEDVKEISYLEMFLKFLSECQIVEMIDGKDSESPHQVKYTRPLFLRKGDRPVDEIAHLLWISGPNTSDTGT